MSAETGWSREDEHEQRKEVDEQLE